MWTRNHFFDVRLGIGARLFSASMIGCTYKSERTLEDSFIYVRYQEVGRAEFIFVCTANHKCAKKSSVRTINKKMGV